MRREIWLVLAVGTALFTLACGGCRTEKRDSARPATAESEDASTHGKAADEMTDRDANRAIRQMQERDQLRNNKKPRAPRPHGGNRAVDQPIRR